MCVRQCVWAADCACVEECYFVFQSLFRHKSALCQSFLHVPRLLSQRKLVAFLATFLVCIFLQMQTETTRLRGFFQVRIYVVKLFLIHIM